MESLKPAHQKNNGILGGGQVEIGLEAPCFGITATPFV